MTFHSPILAMLWEQWRLTRVEGAYRLALGIVAASAALALFHADVHVVFWILFFPHSIVWLSISKLNGGRFLDGYKPGFPLYLLYTRPVPTYSIVGVAMLYDAITLAAMYLVSAGLVGFAFGVQLPLFSVIPWLVSFHLICTAIQWSTPNRIVQWAGSLIVCWPFYFLLTERIKASLQFEFSLTANAVMVLAGVVAMGLTMVGIARQRRGDAVAAVPQKSGTTGYPVWLISLFRLQCPTSSATRAQVWFELRSSGLPVLAIGLGIAVLIFLLYAVSIFVAPARNAAVGVTMFLAPAAMLIFLVGNAFGIRRRQGRTYASTFEATKPYGTAQLAGLKILVRTICVLIALLVVGATAWKSSSFLYSWDAWMVGGKDASMGLRETRWKIIESFAGATWYVYAVQALVASIGVVALIAGRAAFTALRARYSRRVNIVSSALLGYVLALVLLSQAGHAGLVSASLVNAIGAATLWGAAAVFFMATAYLAWRVLAERLISPRHASGVVLFLAALGVVWLLLLRAVGLSPNGLLAAEEVWKLWPVLLLLSIIVLAPWSFSRIRHT